MDMSLIFSQVLISFLTLFIILDPFLGLAVFVSLTNGLDKKEKAKQAFIAVFVAFALLVMFLFLGTFLLDLLNITLSSFKAAGGLILLVLGVESVLGIGFGNKHKKRKVLAVIIGTPLLCGPGAISTVIILSQKFGYLAPLISISLSIVITFFMLYYSNKISAILGSRVIEVISRVLGLFLAAFAIEMIKDGVIDMIRDFKDVVIK